MSFGSEVKRELMSIENDSPEIERALIVGLLQNLSEIMIDHEGCKLVIKSHVLNVIKFISKYLKNHYQTKEELKTKEKNSLNDFRYYYLEIQNQVEEIINDFHLLDYEDIDIMMLDLLTVEEKYAFVRGLFIAHGSISDPRKSTYHLEINCPKSSIATLAKQIISSFGIESSIYTRGNNSVLYIKKSEDISQMLALLGAMQGMFNFEDSRIYRDFKNMANRVTNCDIANERKCLATCKKQLDAIAYIRKQNKFNEMSIRLQSIAILWEMYPDSSNEELSEYSSNVFGKELSKSGISHCFRSLMEYYQMILLEKDKK